MGFVFAVDFKRSAKPHFHINFYLCFRPISEGAVIFCKKMTGGVFSQFDVTYLNSFSFALLNSFALLRCPILLMRLGAPHKIDRCANRCSLYPPQAAVAYVARRGSGTSRIILYSTRRDSPCGCPYGNILIRAKHPHLFTIHSYLARRAQTPSVKRKAFDSSLPEGAELFR